MARGRRKEPFVYEGNEYRSVEECCDEMGVSYCAVTTAVSRNGITHEEAIEKQLAKKPFEFNGEIFKTRNEACRKYGVPFANVRSKAERYGISFAEALQSEAEKPFNPNGNAVEYEGRLWKSKRALAKSYGIITETANACAKSKGLSFTEALTYLRKKGMGHEPSVSDVTNNTCFRFRGKYYSSVSKACGEYCIFYPNMKKSLDSGMKPAEALEYWVNEREKRDAERIFEYEGKTYGSLRSCCKEYGLKTKDVRDLLSGENMSRPEAVKECVRRRQEETSEE